MRSLKYLVYKAQWHLRDNFEYTSNFPVHIDLELAGKCQLACTMCPYGDESFTKDMQGMMNHSMALTAIFQAAMLGSKSIKFNFRGEPGLYKNLPDAVHCAKQLGFVETMINTNLLAFNERRLVELCKSGLDLIIISIDGATKKTYESIRKNANWEDLLSRLRFLANLENRPKIRLQIVKQEKNKTEIEKFHEIFSKYSDEIVVQNLRQDNSGERKRCPQPWQRLIIAWNGDVFACCSNWNNEYPIGKFPDQSLYNLWNNNERLKLLRENAKTFEKDPCKNCLVGASYK